MNSVWAIARRVALFGLALVWLVAAVAKLHAASTFSSQTAALGLPSWLPMGALPYGEIALFLVTAAASLFAWRIRPVAVLNGAIYIFFLIFLTWEKAHHLGALGCGCFGALQHGITPSDFIRDGLLMVLSFAIVPKPREAASA
ncbi:MAG: hypothetical protein M0Z66_03875 [Thermaerobacter sp.]|nr:hypothetical protein [Thermaerobacter sp.]